MIKLIDTRLVAKLMRETAKECGMTRVYSSTDSVWTAAMERLAVVNEPEYQKADRFEKWSIERRLGDDHRRIVKAYDFVADNFIELLEAKVKAEGFDLADNRVTLSISRSTYADYEDVDYRNAYTKHYEYRDKVFTKLRKERNIKRAPNTWRDSKEGEALEMLNRRTVWEANDIADKEMPKINPPNLPGKIHGSTYVRMIASFIGERQYKTRYTVTPID